MNQAGSLKMNSAVSVIITTYNKPAALAIAIRSVLNQSHKDTEVIVVDNGLLTATKKTIESFNDPRIKHILQNYNAFEKNYASVKNLNVGLKHAVGKYIAILDDDDYWTDPRKLEKQLRFLEEKPNVIAVGTNGTATLFNSQGEIIMSVNTNQPQDDAVLRENALLANPIAHVSSMYRVSPRLLYDEKLKRAKDWDMFLRLGKLGKLGNIPDNTVTWGDVRTAKKRRDDAYWCLRVIWKHQKNYPHFFKAFFENLKRLIVFSVLATIHYEI